MAILEHCAVPVLHQLIALEAVNLPDRAAVLADVSF